MARYKRSSTTFGGPVYILAGSYIEFDERAADADAPASDKARLYLKDNGSGKTQLVVRFPSGGVQQVAIEP